MWWVWNVCSSSLVVDGFLEASPLGVGSLAGVLGGSGVRWYQGSAAANMLYKKLLYMPSGLTSPL